MKRNILLSLLSALLLSLPWLGAGSYTVLVGVVPLLLISDSYNRGRANFWKTYGLVALALGLWSGTTTWWIAKAPGAEIGAILSALITILLFGGMFMLYHWMSKRTPRSLAYTLLVSGWIACEYLYTVGEVSFPWLTLGNGFAGDIKLVQWYDTFGLFGGTLWIWLVNLTIFVAIKARTKQRYVIAAFVVVVPIVASLVRYYTYTERGREITVTVVQPNIDPYTDKFYIPEHKQVALMLDLSSTAPSDVDFIVLPETAISQVWENDLEVDPTVGFFRELLREKYPAAQFIVGATSYYRYGAGEKLSQTARENGNITYDIYNSALVVDLERGVRTHHKTKLVVGVEKMPYYSIMKHFEQLIVDMGGTTGQLGVDSVCDSFSSPSGASSGTPICYEGIYGETTAEFVANGAEVLFIISNDGWWGDTQGHRHLFRFARLRAVENRRAIGRSANTGTSGFINQRGDVLQKTGWDIQTTITQRIKANDHITFYTRSGDSVARISVYVFVLSLLYFVAYTYRRRNLIE